MKLAKNVKPSVTSSVYVREMNGECCGLSPEPQLWTVTLLYPHIPEEHAERAHCNVL